MLDFQALFHPNPSRITYVMGTYILFRATKSCTLFSYTLPDYVRGLLVVCKVFRDISVLETLQRRHLRNTPINVDLMLLSKLL